MQVIRTDTVGKPMSEPSRRRRYEHEHLCICDGYRVVPKRTLYRPNAQLAK